MKGSIQRVKSTSSESTEEMKSGTELKEIYGEEAPYKHDIDVGAEAQFKRGDEEGAEDGAPDDTAQQPRRSAETALTTTYLARYEEHEHKEEKEDPERDEDA